LVPPGGGPTDTVPVPPLPADALLVGLCADLTTNESERRRIIAMIASQPDTQPGLARAVRMHPQLTKLTVERQALIKMITATQARTLHGLKVKANIVRILIDDLPVPRNVRVELAHSLAADVAGVAR